jgi:hypothetical protein
LVIALANKQKIPAFTIKPLEIEMKDCLTKIEEIVFWYEIRLFAFKNNFSSIYSAIEDYTLQDNIRLFDLLLDKKNKDKAKIAEVPTLLQRYNRIQADNYFVTSLNLEINEVIVWANKIAEARPEADKNSAVNYLCYNVLQNKYPNDCYYSAYQAVLNAFNSTKEYRWKTDS